MAYPQGSVPAAKLANVERSIIQAGSELGWVVTRAARGHLVATLDVRKHTAVVDIHYTPTDYSILYKNSMNLKSDGTMIHRQYNNWIQNLNKRIRIKLAALM